MSKVLSADDVRELLRRDVEKAGGLTAWAKKHGTSRQYVWQMLNYGRPVGAIALRALGIERRYIYALDSERECA